MFGLTFDKLAIIAILAAFLLGPERLPYYAGRLAALVRGLRDLADTAKSRLKEEMGPEFDDMDWKTLDPRQYDPRRIVREALASDAVVTTVATTEAGAPAEARTSNSAEPLEPVTSAAVSSKLEHELVPQPRPVLKAGSDGRYRRV